MSTMIFAACHKLRPIELPGYARSGQVCEACAIGLNRWSGEQITISKALVQTAFVRLLDHTEQFHQACLVNEMRKYLVRF